MQTVPNTLDGRILFFDHIRYLLVLLVVVLHVACAYSHYTTWWPVNDLNAVFFDHLLRILGVFLMPGLFFIAGYFALPSLRTKTTWLFIRRKLIRLGLPWLIGVILLGPIRIYLYYYSREYQLSDLWRIFIRHLESAMTFHTGYITTVSQFNHLHFWFISLLLFFFIVFALLHHVWSWMVPDSRFPEKSETPSNRSILLVLIFVCLISTGATFLMHGIFSKGPVREPWVMIGSMLVFQPTRVVLYVFCFMLGIYAFHKKWFNNGQAPGHFFFWFMLSLLLWFGRERVLEILLTNFSMTAGIVFLLIRTSLFFSILLALISFSGRYWRSSTRLNRILAANSYVIYLVHMVFVYGIQLLFKWWETSIYIKFTLGSGMAVLLSLLFSHFIIRQYPRLSVAGMAGIFMLLLVFVK